MKRARWTSNSVVNQGKISQESCRISRNFNAEWRQKGRPDGVWHLMNTASKFANLKFLYFFNNKQKQSSTPSAETEGVLLSCALSDWMNSYFTVT